MDKLLEIHLEPGDHFSGSNLIDNFMSTCHDQEFNAKIRGHGKYCISGKRRDIEMIFSNDLKS